MLYDSAEYTQPDHKKWTR